MEITENCVLELISDISPNKATGFDEISAKIIKMAAPTIVSSLTHIINLSLFSGVIPQEWKSAKIVPIFKSGSATDRANYRPISVLPVLSKIIEKVVHKQMTDYLSENSILFVNQSGFRHGHSTTTALLNVIEDLSHSIDNGSVTGFVALDLKRAFDTVDHYILLEKLKLYGFDDVSVRWFKNYLSDRTQRTSINGSLSSLADVKIRSPSGLYLGPNFDFVIYK